MKRGLKYLFSIFVFMLFSSNIYADSYCMDLRTSNSKTLKKGDIIELKAGISGVAEKYSISNYTLNFYFDGNIFELVKYNDGNVFQIKTGWHYNAVSTSSSKDGNVILELGANSYNDKIVAKMFTNTSCVDGGFVNLVSYKLKVKDVENQKTNVFVTDENGYKKSIDLNIYNSSSNNYLKNLVIDNVTFEKSFDKDTLEYIGEVDYEIDKINIKTELSDSKSKVSGDGEQNLEVGENEFKIVVTSESGEKREYIVKITRKEADNDTSLSKVIVTDSNGKKLNLHYDKEKKTYSQDVTSDIVYVNFDITCSGKECKVSELKTKNLVDGENIIKFTVTSQDKKEEEYTIKIYRLEAKKDNSKLILTISLIISVLLNIGAVVFYIIKKKQSKIL